MGASVHHIGVATMRNLLLVALTLIACACTTTFYGDPKVREGPSGCEAICTAWNMELVGMVALGEYSDGCICQKKGSEVSLQDVGQVVILSFGIYTHRCIRREPPGRPLTKAGLHIPSQRAYAC